MPITNDERQPESLSLQPSGPPVAYWQTYRRLWVFIRPYLRPLSFVVIVSLGATALTLFQPYISKLLIDRALLRRDMHALVWIAGIMFVTSALGFVFNILASYRYVKISAAMLFDIRLALFQHLQTLSPRFYARYRLGDLMSRLNNDAGEVQRVSADALLSVLSNVGFLIGSVAMMLWLNWRLFLVGVVLIPACIYTFARYQRILTALTKQLRERSADLGSFFVDSILGMRVVVSLNAGDREAERFRERNDAFVQTMLKVQVASFMTGALPGTILTVATTVVFLYGGWQIIQGTMTIGTLVAFMAYHTRLLSPVQNLMSLTASLASARVSLGRIFELFDTTPEVTEAPDAVPLPPVQGAIRLEGVSIRHDRAAVLEDVSLEIPAGSFCAILGPSGVGKSTLADLLVRYLDPDQGRILIDGRDIRQFRLADLREQIVLVDQTPYLFNATIAENIAYARAGASRQEIEEAGRAAGLDELIARLPQGYETTTGERGLALSVGERQRISLARALLRHPRVLILDEPTSALDGEMEKQIAVSLRTAMQGGTLIVITHRPALAEIAGAVITVRDGGARMTSVRHDFNAAIA
jgi:ATP-binding cassette, subfamily B, bacterial